MDTKRLETLRLSDSELRFGVTGWPGVLYMFWESGTQIQTDRELKDKINNVYVLNSEQEHDGSGSTIHGQQEKTTE